jgi:serine/threonine-protein phosphatase 2B catalytic subunit
VQVVQPCVVVGDIHGQYFDLCGIIEKSQISSNNLVFLGDYVDRGLHSLECVILLCTLKLNYPKKVILLRGNHESRQCAEHFNFRADVLERYDQEVYEQIMLTFDALPLVAVIGGQYLCVHGGISPDFVDI